MDERPIVKGVTVEVWSAGIWTHNLLPVQNKAVF